MTEYQRRFIKDNPNLKHSIIARLTPISASAVKEYRKRQGVNGPFFYNGIGDPDIENKKMSKSKISLLNKFLYRR